MTKRKPMPWGIWVTSSKQWMTSGNGRKARYELKREAAKEADEFNRVLKKGNKVFEARKI